MSLRLRLNLLITTLFLVLLAGGAFLVIHNARTAVSEEMRSTANLALRLLEVSEAAGGHESRHQARAALLAHLGELEKTRHLKIELRGPGRVSTVSPPGVPASASTRAPAWFAGLVEPAPLVLKRAIGGDREPSEEIVIRADPRDEIGEAWEEARTTLTLLIILTVLANVLVYFTVGRALQPIDRIIAGLDDIEQGNYSTRLEHAGIPELEGIVDKVNRIAHSLESSREQTRYLTLKSLAIQEDERRRLARELHDELGQSISAINAVAQSISHAAEDRLPAAAASARTITGVAKRVHGVIRDMMSRLRPPTLDELGLRSALEQLVEDWNAHHADLVCRLQVEAELAPLDAQVEIAVYRVVQEALTNVVNHARADRVDIELSRNADSGELAVCICDNGVGMDPATARMGLGLLGMRERVEALHGRFSMDTRPGEGMQLHIFLPAATTSEGTDAAV